MKILSAQQIREADAATIAEENIDGHVLMERAAKAFSNRLLATYTCNGTTWVFCGTGNNGGDGLCIARHLLDAGYIVRVVIVGEIKTTTEGFNLNLGRLKKYGDMIISFSYDIDLPLHDDDMIIDAIFGTGLNRPPENIHADAISFINDQDIATIAVDIPSGLPADEMATGICVEADITITFEFPKLSFFFPEHQQYTGVWEIVRIGLSKKYIDTASTNYFYTTETDVRPHLQQRNKFGHKGTYGHSLIIAGTPGTAGAAELCAYACLVTGSGLVTVSTGNTSASFAELMTVNRSEIIAQLKNKKYSTIGIGPGLGTDEDETALLKTVLQEFDRPVVVDADALNIIAAIKELLQHVPKNSILTPHPKEFERLFGVFANEAERLQKQMELSIHHQLIIVYKRANTVITTPAGTVHFNSTGNPGMATAGSGDVLTGIITALLAQQYAPEDAAIFGVYLHGLAGDMAMAELGGQNLVAEDLINFIPAVFEYMS